MGADKLRVLVACEFSGIVRDSFRRRGHDAVSCDLLDTEVDGPHIKGSVLDVLDRGWDLMIAHPPCTRLCLSGLRWLYERDLWDELQEAANFFLQLWNAPIPRICVENPIPHGHATRLLGVRYSQRLQPWQFGDGETKATCLWLKNLPPLCSTNIVPGRIARVHREPPGPEKQKNRSRTYRGVADAMAAQWGDGLVVPHREGLWKVLQ